MAINEQICNFTERANREIQELSKLAVPVSAKAFGNVARGRSGGILALVAKSEIASDVRLRGNCDDQSAQFVGKLPSNEIGELFGHCAIADAIAGPDLNR